MLTNSIQSVQLKAQPKYLWFLILSYTMVLVMSNWFDPRLIHFFNLNTDAGTLIFPLTFLQADLITEVYGYKHARRAIWCGFLFNLIFIIYGQMIIHLPSPNYFDNSNFDALILINTRIIIASAVSYLCSEPFNSYIMAKLKIKFHGGIPGVRFVTSTFIASLIDSTVFSILAFYGSIENSHLLSFILSMWLIKCIVEIIGLPLSIRLAKKLKALEHMDIYDKNTNFNILSLNINYTANDNEFNQPLKTKS